MCKCKKCGKEIKFIRNARDRTTVAVDRAAVMYLPPSGFERDETFISPSGSAVNGRRVSDGITGYKMHECKGATG